MFGQEGAVPLSVSYFEVNGQTDNVRSSGDRQPSVMQVNLPRFYRETRTNLLLTMLLQLENDEMNEAAEFMLARLALNK
jgi:hypothetical protein